MGVLKKLWHNPKVREVRHKLEDKAEEEGREWVDKKLGRTTPIAGAAHDADGEPYETHHPGEPLTEQELQENLDAIGRRENRR